jgi:molecular chaperone GrpE
MSEQGYQPGDQPRAPEGQDNDQPSGAPAGDGLYGDEELLQAAVNALDTEDQGAGSETAEGDLALGSLQRQRDEYLDSLRRLQAEFDNYRKRVDRQQRELRDHAATSLVTKLLPVLDTADLALAHGGGEEVKQVAGALFDVLAKEGLQRIVPEGQPFDPQRHDAVAHEPAEGGDGPEVPEVSEVLRAGYEWKGRVLRPAMVKVRG